MFTVKTASLTEGFCQLIRICLDCILVYNIRGLNPHFYSNIRQLSKREVTLPRYLSSCCCGCNFYLCFCKKFDIA